MEILHNDIVLPDEWPPRNVVSDKRSLAGIPYLINPPAAIPIDHARQLFVDDFLIAETTLQRRFHKPR